jgi:CRISPR-associated exonuclease Cas4
LTEEMARRLHELVASGVVPAPVPHLKCQQCSLRDACLPHLIADPRAYGRAIKALFRTTD